MLQISHPVFWPDWRATNLKQADLYFIFPVSGHNCSPQAFDVTHLPFHPVGVWTNRFSAPKICGDFLYWAQLCRCHPASWIFPCQDPPEFRLTLDTNTVASVIPPGPQGFSLNNYKQFCFCRMRFNERLVTVVTKTKKKKGANNHKWKCVANKSVFWC